MTMEDVLSKCRLCLKICSEEAIELFWGENANIYTEQITDMLSIEVISLPVF